MTRTLRTVLPVLFVAAATSVCAQTIEITSVPAFGTVGLMTGVVTGVDPATHRVAPTINIEGVGWWTKPSFGNPTVAINPDGTFEVPVGLFGLDDAATTYSVSLLPNGVNPPPMSSSPSLDLGPSSLASDYLQRYGTNLNFAGRNWGVKDVPALVGPGSNRFSADPQDVWVDQDGLHLTVQNRGGQWYNSEVILTEELGYGTYMFQTSSRQDILDANVTFGGFTWDNFGDDLEIPAWPHREIDFEDSRWGNPAEPTNSQAVVQPYHVPGALKRITLPDLSANAELTRFFHWGPDQIEYYTLLGHHQPDNFPPSAIIDHTIITENLALGRIIPDPGRENFRFNLWLNNNSGTFSGQSVEVVINDFQFIPDAIPGDFNLNGTVEGLDFLDWQQGQSPNPLSAADLTDWENNYGSGVSVAVVPEPATLLLMAMAGCLALRSHHSRR